MEKLRLFIWELLYPPERQAEKKREFIAKRLWKLIKGGTGGGLTALTFWEKVKIGIILLILMGITAGLYLALIFASPQL